MVRHWPLHSPSNRFLGLLCIIGAWSGPLKLPTRATIGPIALSSILSVSIEPFGPR
jgi:hypothetical protein